MKLLAAALLAAMLTACTSVASPTGKASTTSRVPAASTPASNVGPGPNEPIARPSAEAISGYKTVGKFFVRALGSQFSCTATVIGRNIIVTAAHCFQGVIGGIRYATTGWTCAPMWHDNQFPYGTWSVLGVYLLRGWIDKLDPRLDYAVVVLNPRSGRDVGSYTGQDSWNSSLILAPGQSTPVRVVGIPEASAEARISVTRAVAVQVGRGFTVLTASTPGFGNGTSGGPWFSAFSPQTDTGTVIAVTGGYQDGGVTDSPSYADLLSGQFADLVAAAIKGATQCNPDGACRYWP
jgi:Trypsin